MELANQFFSRFHFLKFYRLRNFEENYVSTLHIVRDVTAEYLNNCWGNIIFQQPCFLRIAI